MPLRISLFLIGLLLYGAGAGIMVRAGIGIDPWAVLAQGISVHTGIGMGWITNAVGLLVLLLWIPLRQKPRIGTFANILLVGTSMQFTLDLIPNVQGFPLQVAVFGLGMILLSVAAGLYLAADFGAGPRDGLMTGIHSRFGWPIWASRLAVETSVLAAGWLLGGTVGLGTLLFAFGIGTLMHRTIPFFRRLAPSPHASGTAPATAGGGATCTNADSAVR